MRRSISELLEKKALQFLISLPFEQILSPIIIDNCKLHPEMQVYLWIRKLMGRPAMGELPPIDSRRTYVKDSVIHGIDVQNIEVHDYKIKEGLTGKLYALSSRKAPLIVYYHGGGFVIGDNEMYGHVYRYICAETGFKVFAVNYGKAPEHPFPIGLEDAITGYKFAISHSGEMNFDLSEVYIAGDSAGANLATVICQILVAEKFHLPKKQLLFYPTCDWCEDYKSAQYFATGFFLTQKDFEYFALNYHGGKPQNLSDFRISPLRGRLEGVPSSIIVTAGFDPLRDQGDAYALKLKEAGVFVIHMREEGMIHGFINLIGFSQYARTVTSKALSFLKS